ncbi:MAG: hypothetical protein DMG35_15095 [Acidobacteria bacterium]|nr:MAG: hypothetical protein AUH86_01465 [Acidobacteria bacterium 13_1_40CM_4_58_4]PYT59247.1 MAG: hypothetical protein DMG35_15095 [Acidobacteriota bacterium]
MRVALSRRLTAFLIAGAAIGLLGVVLFGVVHALIIVPIWTRLFGGVPFALPAGLAMGWALYELQAASRLGEGAFSGLVFGFLVWLTLLPMTAFTVFVRAAGLHSREGYWESTVELLLASGTGALLGHLISRQWRPAIAMGIASLAVALAQAGPIPVINSSRTAWLFAALGLIYLACGFALGLLSSAILRRSKSQP